MHSSYRFGRFEVRPGERQLLAEGVPQPVGSRAFDLLLTLIERRDRLVTKNELLEQVWPGLVVEDNNVQVHISALRKLLGASAIATVAGRGYRFTAGVEQDAVGGGPAAPSPPPGAAHNLPRARTRFIGREAERARLAQLVREHALVTLTGIGGVGKTRLAQRLGEDLLAEFPGGACHVDLIPAQNADEVPMAALRALGVQLAPRAEATDVLARKIGARRMLLILDNCEHVLDAASALVESLLVRCEALTVLATSREALGLPGEQVLPVRPLQLAIEPGADDRSDAVQLFVERARLVDPDFVLDDAGSARLVGEICRRLDGIPLAIELAAARLSVLTLDQIRTRLDDRFRLLTGGGQALARHRTLAAVVDWSYETLSPAEKRLLRGLSVFVGGWNLAAAVDADGDGADEFGVLEVLTRLAGRSLILARRDGEEARYDMLETVRQYAHDQLMAAGEVDAARRRHRHHFLAKVRVLPPDPQERERAVDRLVVDRDNVVAALRDCISQGDADAAVGFVAGLGRRFWDKTQGHRTGLELTAAVRGMTPLEAPALERLKVRLVQGQLAYVIGEYETSLAHATSALEVARELGDVALQSSALVHVVACNTALGNAGDAWAALDEWAPVAHRLGPETDLLRQHYEAELLRSQGRVAEAETVYRQVLDGRTRLHSTHWISLVHVNLAMCALQAGDAARAARHQLQASATAEDPYAEEFAVCLAAVAAALGEWDRAARLAGVDRQYRERTGREWEPLDWAVVGPLLDAAREALGEARYGEAEAAGAALDTRSAIRDASAWLQHLAG